MGKTSWNAMKVRPNRKNTPQITRKRRLESSAAAVAGLSGAWAAAAAAASASATTAASVPATLPSFSLPATLPSFAARSVPVSESMTSAKTKSTSTNAATTAHGSRNGKRPNSPVAAKVAGYCVAGSARDPPSTGPSMPPSPKTAPIIAKARASLDESVMSAMYERATGTLPLERPCAKRTAMRMGSDGASPKAVTPTALPSMPARMTGRRPMRSERPPQKGAASTCPSV